MAEWDLIIIGGGPGGYVAALRAAQLGQKVVLVEKEELGGVCMNWGCIPTKFLLHQTALVSLIEQNEYLCHSEDKISLDWSKLQVGRRKIVSQLVKGVEFLLNRHKVEIIKGEGHLTSALEVEVRLNNGGRKTLKAEHILLATGSRPAELPFLQADGQQILTSQQLLEIEQPPQKMIILGAGAIGLEMATIFCRLGTEVTLLEIMPNILPGAEETLTRRLERILKRRGMKIVTEMKVEKVQAGTRGVVVEGTCLRIHQPYREEGEIMLLAIGRRPNLAVLGEAQEKFELTPAGFLKVDKNFKTSVPQVWAIGDVIGGKLLAHKASHQGITVVENLSGQATDFREELVPLAVFTEPELASVGLTERELKEKQINYSVGQFHLRASGRALTMGETEGVVKILVDNQGYLQGAHLLAPHASEMIPELVLAMKEKIPAIRIGETIHIHPTLSEVIMEAALHTAGRAIHTLND